MPIFAADVLMVFVSTAVYCDAEDDEDDDCDDF
jgi:hypothetical protein